MTISERILMDIGHVLQITSKQPLTGKEIDNEEEIAAASPESRFTRYDIRLIEDYHGLREEQQRRLVKLYGCFEENRKSGGNADLGI